MEVFKRQHWIVTECKVNKLLHFLPVARHEGLSQKLNHRKYLVLFKDYEPEAMLNHFRLFPNYLINAYRKACLDVDWSGSHLSIPLILLDVLLLLKPHCLLLIRLWYLEGVLWEWDGWVDVVGLVGHPEVGGCLMVKLLLVGIEESICSFCELPFDVNAAIFYAWSIELLLWLNSLFIELRLLFLYF